jgi:hypothetical protein
MIEKLVEGAQGYGAKIGCYDGRSCGSIPRRGASNIAL